MGSTPRPQPPAPTAAERARSLMARGGSPAVVGSGAPTATPLVHHVRADGSAVLLLADGDPVLAMIQTGARIDATGSGRRGGPGAAAMLELADLAPVDLREPVRALLWITGRLTMPDPATARGLAMQVADVHPHADLLRLGHGATMARLDPGSVVLSDAEGTAALGPLDLAAARPDPFARHERAWLAHLEATHPGVFVRLARHLPHDLADVARDVARDSGHARVRPLGVDRCGLRLRVETAERDHDVRLPWSGAPTTATDLHDELHALLCCARGRHGRASDRAGQDRPVS